MKSKVKKQLIHVTSPSLPPSLHPRLMEHILGKSPLRLVASRTCVSKGIWKEILECGHEYTTFTQYLWEYSGRLIEAEITAKRRRCQKCKPAVAAVLKTSAELTADQARAELIHKRKLQFGSLFDKLCDENGELRPGPTEAELLAELKTSSPRKPVQSVRRIEKRRIA
jgi:hypothetical protein